MIDYRLQVLDAVQRHGTITAAAEALHLTPSAVSHQIRALARELELTLLEPAGRNVRLTSAAHTLLAHADVLFAQWENAQAELAAHRAGGLSGRLRLCGFSTAAAAFLPDAAARLREAYPRLSVQIIETEPGPAFDLLASGQADTAVVVATPGIPPATDARFDQQRLYDEPLDLLVPADHPYAGSQSIALYDAATDPWIVGTPGGAYHHLVLLACASASFSPTIAHYANEWDTGAALVSQGFGVALLPRLAHIPVHHHTVRLPLYGEPAPIRHILTATRAGSSHQPAISAGLNALRHVAGEQPSLSFDSET